MTIDTATPWYWEPFDFFRDATPDARDAFFKASVKLRYARGDYIVMANDAGRRIFFLEDGIVKIFNLSPNGTQTIFWFCVQGDVFGAHFTTRTDFERILKQYPQIAINMIRMLGARLRLACDSMVDISERKAESRLARVLLRLAHNYGMRAGDRVAIRVQVSHQELADMIGSSRQTVNALLHEFSKSGWIDLKGRTFSIVSKADLQEITENSGSS